MSGRNWFGLTFFLLIFGKFYYLTHGWHDHLQPEAPVYLIAVKDLIFATLVGCFTALAGLSAPAFGARRVNLWLALLATGLMTLASLHLLRMPVGEWVQHYLRNSLIYLLMVAISYNVLEQKDIDFFFKIIVAACLCNLPVIVLSQLYWPERVFDGRVIGLFDNPNTLAGALSFGLIIALVDFAYFRRLWDLVIIIMLLWATLAAGSLSYLGFDLVVIALLGMRGLARRGHYLTLLLVAAAPAALMIAFVNVFPTLELSQRVIAVFLNPWEINTLAVRLDNYAVITDLLARGDVVGLFFGLFATEDYLRYDSSPVVILTNYGLLGLVLVVVPFAWLWWRGFVEKGKRPSLEQRQLDILLASLGLFAASAFVHNVFNRYPLNVIAYLELGMLLLLTVGKSGPREIWSSLER